MIPAQTTMVEAHDRVLRVYGSVAHYMAIQRWRRIHPDAPIFRMESPERPRDLRIAERPGHPFPDRTLP